METAGKNHLARRPMWLELVADAGPMLIFFVVILLLDRSHLQCLMAAGFGAGVISSVRELRQRLNAGQDEIDREDGLFWFRVTYGTGLPLLFFGFRFVEMQKPEWFSPLLISVIALGSLFGLCNFIVGSRRKAGSE